MTPASHTDDEYERLHAKWWSYVVKTVKLNSGHRIVGVAPDTLRCQDCGREWSWEQVEVYWLVLLPWCTQEHENEV